MLLSLMGKWAPGRGAQWPWCPHPQDLAAHRVPPEPEGTHPPVTRQPLAALLSLLVTQGCPGGGGLAGPSLPLGSLLATNGLPCPGTGLLPTSWDFSSQLLGLFGQLAASSDPTSGTFPWSKASGHNGSPGLWGSARGAGQLAGSRAAADVPLSTGDGPRPGVATPVVLGGFLPPGSPLWLWGQVGGSGTRWDMAVDLCCGWWDLVECDHESRMWWDPVGCGHRFMLGVVACGCGCRGMWWDTVGPSRGFILVVGGMWLWVWQDVVCCIHGPAADVAVAAPCSDLSPAGAAGSPGVPKGAVALGAGSNGEGGAGLPACPLQPSL